MLWGLCAVRATDRACPAVSDSGLRCTMLRGHVGLWHRCFRPAGDNGRPRVDEWWPV